MSDDDNNDFLAGLQRKYELPPPGKYQVRLISEGLQEIDNIKAVTLRCNVEIVGGKLPGKRVALSFQIAGTEAQVAFVRRDMTLLLAWANALGVGKATGGMDLLVALGRAGEDRKLSMTFAVTNDVKIGPQLLIAKIEVDAATAAAAGDSDAS